MSDNLYNSIQRSARDCPQAVAIETEQGELITYSALEEWTGRCATALRALGAAPGDRVLVQADKSARLLMLCYAVIRAGAVLVPVNPGARPREVAGMVADCQPAVVICDPRRQRQFEALRETSGGRCSVEVLSPLGRGSLPDAAARFAYSPAIEPVRPDAPAALMYTSGTTGRAKAAIITHGNVLANGQALREFWRWSLGEVLLHTLPLFHLHGLFVATMPSLMSGSRILLHRRFLAWQAIAALPRVSVFMGVPTYFTRLLASPALTRAQCAGVRLFISGSAPLREQTYQQFRECTGHEILWRYGLTETGGVACNPPHSLRTLGRVGIPLPGFAVRIAGDGPESSPGPVGEVQVKGPSVSPGYWRRPDETRLAFTADGYFRTGDLGCRLADGSLEIVGRAKDVIITGGANVNPLEVEAALDACPGVAESAVIGVPHPDYGEAVIAFVVPRTDHHSSVARTRNTKELLARLKRELALYKVPRRIIFRTELPRNAMGKIQRNLLRSDPALLEPAGPPGPGVLR